MEYEEYESDVEPNGVFWFPDSKEKKMNGWCYISNRGELKVLLVDNKNVLEKRFKGKNAIFKENVEDIILGELREELFSLTLIKNSINRRDDYPEVYEVIPYLMINNAHFNSLDEIKFRELTISYDYLPYWARNVNENIEIEIENAKVTLILSNEVPHFKVEFGNERSLKECLEIEENIRQFLSFVSGWKFDIAKFKALKNKREVEIIKPRAMNLSNQNLDIPYEPFIAFKDVCDSFDNYLKKWFEIMKNKNLRAAINYQLYSDYDIGIPEFTFLTHVFILEMYHSTKFETSMFEEEEDWKTLKNCINDCIKRFVENKEIKSVLNGRVGRMHDKSLKQKLHEILDFLRPKRSKRWFRRYKNKMLRYKELKFKRFRRKFFGTMNEIGNFIKNVADYRNSMAHSLEIPPSKELEEWNPKLKAIFKACILKDLGFDDGLIIQGINKYLKMLEKYQLYQVSLD